KEGSDLEFDGRRRDRAGFHVHRPANDAGSGPATDIDHLGDDASGRVTDVARATDLDVGGPADKEAAALATGRRANRAIGVAVARGEWVDTTSAHTTPGARTTAIQVGRAIAIRGTDRERMTAVIVPPRHRGWRIAWKDVIAIDARNGAIAARWGCARARTNL